METNNNNKSRFFIIVLSIGLAITIAVALLFYSYNKELEIQILKRENLIKKAIAKESTLSKQKTKNDSIIEKYIDDCGIRINNKKVSTDDLLQYMNLQILEIDEQKNKNNKLSDSLQVYKSYINLSKNNLKVNYSTKKENNKIISSIIIPRNDSLNVYKGLYQLMKEKYGISYKVEIKKDQITYIKEYTKLDSALFVYKYYKHVLSGDSLGNIVIDLPKKAEIKKSKKK